MADSFKRRITILQMLKQKEDGMITIPEIIRRLGAQGFTTIQSKTIERDMTYLSTEFNIGCNDQVRPFQWWWNGEETIDIPGMGKNAALTFNLAEEYLKPLLPKTTLQYMQSQFRQSKKVLTGKGREKEKSWAEKIRVVPRLLNQIPAKVDEHIYETIYQALYEEKVLLIDYYAAVSHSYSENRIHPLALLYRGLNTELLAYDEADEIIKRFILNRVKNARIQIQSISVPDDFVLDDFIETSLGFPRNGNEITFKAKLNGYACTNVREMKLSKNQKIEKINKDECIVTATVRDTVDLMHWIFSLAEFITVLEPEYLRNDVQSMIQNMLKNYQR